MDMRYSGIGMLLSEGRLKVPVNQRDYSWEDHHAVTLCHDIAEAISKGNDSYFLGTIVLTSQNGILEVVDGQQRLATAMMILAAIRDMFIKSGDMPLVTSIQQDYLFRIDPDTEEEVPKLVLNLRDREFFLERVLRPHGHKLRVAKTKNAASSTKKIEEAAKAIREYLERSSKAFKRNAKKDFLKTWLKYIRENAKLIVLTASNQQNAYLMFETLNGRGIKVSEADLVKNYLFSQAGDRLNEVQTRWNTMINLLELVEKEDAAIDYLRILYSVLGGLTRERHVFSAVRAQVSSQHTALSFSRTLEEFAYDYVAMLLPDHQKWNSYPESTRRALHTLNLFGVTQIRHLMLGVSHYFNKKEADRAYRLFVNWIVRMFIAGAGRVGRVESIYADMAFHVHKAAPGKTTIRTAEELAERMSKNLAGDKEFKDMYAVTHVRNVKLARYYLDSLERKLSKVDMAELVPHESKDVVNIEHILPLRPDADAWNRISPEIAEAYASRLGNLVLLNARQNSKLGKCSFQEKRQIFQRSGFRLTQEAGKYEKWGPEEIEQRQKHLSEIAVKTWPLKTW